MYSDVIICNQIFTVLFIRRGVTRARANLTHGAATALLHAYVLASDSLVLLLPSPTPSTMHSCTFDVKTLARDTRTYAPRDVIGPSLRAISYSFLISDS